MRFSLFCTHSVQNNKPPLIGYPKYDWLCFFCLAFISTILGQTILNWLIKWLSTSTISMSMVGEPVVTCILAYFILGQAISYNQILGSVIILIGIAIFLIGQMTRPGKEQLGNVGEKLNKLDKRG
ncbi:DMT family transporter [Clostridium ljungdahlii]|uniref:EamA-like transporter family protein n=1 Tax=Clostridium ljungdahlii TaxID=1538 RepID=A0A168RA41_9CLOT|nr:DMT family transporter [Clostridium ljungdahlii]OAA90423.1 EamA-like transporter family protein [Clostridium ljungdahlii]